MLREHIVTVKSVSDMNYSDVVPCEAKRMDGDHMDRDGRVYTEEIVG